MAKSDFFKFENKNDDFPFYNGKPFSFTYAQGIFLLLVSILSVVAYQMLEGSIPTFVQPIFNIIFPLGAFILVVKSNWTRIFRKIRLKDILLIIGVVIFNFILNIFIGSIMNKLVDAGANPAVTLIQHNSLAENIVFFLKMIPMLLGEELITIIPFLVILTFATKTLKLSRKKAIILAWIVSAIIFGALHLPTYSWNIAQAVLGISISRLVLTFPYVKTKNIWISLFVHVLNDWFIFLPALLASLV
jgi:hypothetical protein